jgi:lysophospholipase L1-like esterase
VIVICPPPTADSPVFRPKFGDSTELSKKLPPLYRQLARECGALYLDAGEHISSSGADGIHLDPEAHLKLAELVAEIVKDL